jgi:hypothetical protein
MRSEIAKRGRSLVELAAAGVGASHVRVRESRVCARIYLLP